MYYVILNIMYNDFVSTILLTQYSEKRSPVRHIRPQEFLVSLCLTVTVSIWPAGDTLSLFNIIWI